MTDGDALLKKRFAELSERADRRGVWTYSEFLTMAEQELLERTPDAAPFTLFGGYDGAERRVACFGDEADFGFEASPPVRCLKAAPLSDKFAEPLSHRDYLGALMSLGVRREALGDVAVTDGGVYIFCLDSVAAYIADGLSSVRRTPVSCAEVESPAELLTRAPEERSLVVPSDRADALTAAVYGLSRAAAQELFSKGRVFVNARLLENASRSLREGDVVSVRGRGRFIYDGAERETKKGRLRIRVRVF